jgi:UDP-N-acetylglucosamine--dolichyl-phosphate N-acetylglucosaminephosphotransferase
MNPLLFLIVIVSFLFCLIALPWWIKKCRSIGLVWSDMNKYPIGKHKNIAPSGGVVVMAGFILGVLSYITIQILFFENNWLVIIQSLALLFVIFNLSIIGLLDDLLEWKNKNLSKKTRIFLSLIASIPLIIINLGNNFVDVPFLGLVDLGLFFPLVLIPLGVAGVAITYNFLAGFNGLESGQGILILVFLSYVSYVTGSTWLALIGLIMVSSLIVFYFYNKFPAKVFPGDILTYSIGALIAGMAILGDFGKIALVIFIPYFFEMILKLRGRLKKQSFGIPQKDGSLKKPYKKIYGITHFSIWFLEKFKKKVYEKDVVYFIFTIQILFILIGFFMID